MQGWCWGGGGGGGEGGEGGYEWLCNKCWIDVLCLRGNWCVGGGRREGGRRSLHGCSCGSHPTARQYSKNTHANYQ